MMSLCPMIVLCLIGTLVAQAVSGAFSTHRMVENHDSPLHNHHHHHHDSDDHDAHESSEEGAKLKPRPPPEPLGAPLMGHHCIHDQMVAQAPKPVTIPQSYLVQPPWKDWSVAEEQHQMENGGSQRMFAATATSYANMRLKFYFDADNQGKCSTVGTFVNSYQNNNEMVNCTSADVLTDLKRDYVVNTLMPQAANFLRGALNVIPINGSLIAPSTCYGITVPTSHTTTGVSDADFVAYVTSVPLASTSSNGTVAWALSCSNDASGRPTTGHVNFVPSRLTNADVRKPYLETQDVHTAIHEMSHALGFSATYYDQYVDMNNVFHGSGGRTSNVVMANLGKTVTMMTSPRAIAAAQQHFGCSTMTGVEIEDQGGAGTAGSHWEKRILYTEYMAGILSSVTSYISSITLAYFEDKGFYTANYGWAQNGSMTFGQGKGCAFVNNKCNTQTGGEFCFDQTKTDQYCSADFLGQGYCALATYGSALDAAEQYFSNPNLGSAVSLTDYCPTGVAYSNRVCIDGSNSDSQDIYGSTYGSASKCFQSSLISQGYSAGDAAVETRCFPVRCSSAGRIQIDIRGGTALCPLDGSAGVADISGVSGYTGVINCPKSTAFCTDPASTPAPTPAPPTPIPTPAPPGQTPGPAPFTRPPTSATSLPTACADRVACANAVTTRLPWCRSYADALVACFGTNCDAQLSSWLTTNNATCGDPFSWGNAKCVEGPSGGKAMCALLNIVD
jgi:leishmanolysin